MLVYGPAVLLLGALPQELMAYVHKKCVYGITVLKWIDYGLSVHWNTYNFEKVNLVIHATASVNLEQILSERSQIVIKSILCDSTYVGF